jgi:hypothetical protein
MAKSRAISSDETLRAFSDIYIYGKRVIDSEVFDFSFEQVHHYYLSVGESIISNFPTPKNHAEQSV